MILYYSAVVKGIIPKYRLANAPQKLKARLDLRRAVMAGKIERKPCEKCADPKSEAHHQDYQKPFDVQWLCRFHHAELHRQMESV
jgi:protein-arginine kinase activator protein McsA